METKIGTSSQIRSYLSSVKSISARRNTNANSMKVQRSNADIYTHTSGGESYYSSHRAQIDSFTDSIRSAAQMDMPNIAKDDHAGRTKYNFEWISMSENGLNEGIPKRLEDAGVPKDVTFEFDFDFNSRDIEITGVSDEKYRDSIEEILNGFKGPLSFVSCASRVMNGYISSIYYPWVSKALDRCFGQDINDLYIDENGNIGGANQKLKEAINAETKANEKGEYFNAERAYDFPVKKNIAEMLKRLISDENITPNISRMGYDGERIFTNDGEFKFGKDFDPNLFGEEKYVMRGTMAFYMTIYGRYNSWLENEEKFY